MFGHNADSVSAHGPVALTPGVFLLPTGQCLGWGARNCEARSSPEKDSRSKRVHLLFLCSPEDMLIDFTEGKGGRETE